MGNMGVASREETGHRPYPPGDPPSDGEAAGDIQSLCAAVSPCVSGGGNKALLVVEALLLNEMKHMRHTAHVR